MQGAELRRLQLHTDPTRKSSKGGSRFWVLRFKNVPTRKNTLFYTKFYICFFFLTFAVTDFTNLQTAGGGDVDLRFFLFVMHFQNSTCEL